nr:hypothetical protein [Tanacetum cinerariifolium]
MCPSTLDKILENFSLEKLLDIHDNVYTLQAIVDNHLNAKVRELIRTYKKTKKYLEGVMSREVELNAKYDGDVVGLDENPVVISLRAKVRELIRTYKKTKKYLEGVVSREVELNAKYDGDVVKALQVQIKEHKADYRRLLLEEKNWAGQKERVVALELKCNGLEKEKARLCEPEVQGCLFESGKVVEGSMESWVRWWSGEKWRRGLSEAWREIGVNSEVLNVRRRQEKLFEIFTLLVPVVN